MSRARALVRAVWHGLAVLGPLAASAPAQAPVEIWIHACIDGSDRLEIDRDGWGWKTTAWSAPSEPVSIGGQAWDVRREAFVPHTRWRLVPADVDFARAELVVHQARDVVGLERDRDRLVVRFADTPNGSDRCTVLLRLPRCSAAARLPDLALPRATLRLSARIDGSDTLVLDAGGAQWQHRHWAMPADVAVNGVPWRLDRSPTLAHDDAHPFLRAGVDFGSALVRVIRARDTVVSERRADRLLVHLADNQPGADLYEVEISFALGASDLASGSPGRPAARNTPVGVERWPVPHGAVPTGVPPRPGPPENTIRPPSLPPRPWTAAPSDGAPLPPARMTATLHRALPGPTLRVDLSIEAGPARARQCYVTLCSLSGTEPGLTLPGIGRVAVQPDALTLVFLQVLPVAPWLDGLAGTLDDRGRAAPTLRLDAAQRAAISGRCLTCASVIWPASGGLAAGVASNAVDVTIR